AQVAREPASRPGPLRSNLPAATAELIGRTPAIQRLQDLLSAYRMVTLTGPPGIGKSALALEVARSLSSTFEGDRWLVELASLSDPDPVRYAVVGTLGLRLGDDETSTEAVARAIGGRRLLLVLDNCEHVIDAAAELADSLVRLCPQATIL